MRKADKEILIAADRLSTVARRLVGGRGLNGQVTPVRVTELQGAFYQLRLAVDDYDELIWRKSEKKG